MTIRIRNATPQDVDTIREFNQRLAWESESKKLDADTLTLGIAALLQDPAKGRYFLAEIDQKIVGQAMVTYEWSDWRNGWIWWLQSVYVSAQHRKQGVFRRLVEEIRQQAFDQQNVIGLRLYVECENERAQATYQALGIEATNYLVREKIPL